MDDNWHIHTYNIIGDGIWFAVHSAYEELRAEPMRCDVWELCMGAGATIGVGQRRKTS